ncbi:hypothetical protein F2Q69_00031133 [Brassica cretica]|uniref:Uncharacterized protein n=1 Tax=Brassica cretica TaxID=69181 RepID=A0A8S9SB71_BRACR|nr:hypothetical protein F2Q69_00031133 [Brassica cretica]
MLVTSCLLLLLVSFFMEGKCSVAWAAWCAEACHQLSNLSFVFCGSKPSSEATPYDIKYTLISSGRPETYRKPEKSSERKRERREKNLWRFGVLKLRITHVLQPLILIGKDVWRGFILKWCIKTILLSTTLQNLVNASPPLPPPATTSPTVPSGFLPLTPSNPTAATSSSGPSTSLRLAPPATTSSTGPSTSLTLAPPAPSESSLPAAPTFPRSQTGASSFSSLQPPQQRIMPNPPESYLPAATFPRPPQHTSEIVLTSPAFATLPIFPPRNISTQPLLVGPPTVLLGPRNATRLFWTDQLKQAFNEAIQSLGGLYSATVTAEQVKKLMEDLDVTESQIANRIQNLRRKKHPRDDDGGEARLLRFWEVRNVKRGGSLSGWICSWWMLTVGTDNLLKFTPLIRTDRFLTMFQATMMQVTISSRLLPQYRERLIAGTMFSMSGFDVSRCAQSFRLTSLLC